MVIGIVAVAGCSETGIPVDSGDRHGEFEIYFLRDSTATTYSIRMVSIDQLELNDFPWLSDAGVSMYDFSSHCIYLKQDKSRYFDGYGDYYRYGLFMRGRPFVVVAGKQRCYVGELRSAALSSVPTIPYMDEMDIGFFPDDIMHISKGWSDSTDPRGDGRISDVLQSLGLLHGGIAVALSSVAVLDNDDTSTVSYTYRLTNNDSENLLVLDPLKTGSSLFHYFTNGPVLQNEQQYALSLYKFVSTPTVEWDPAWYSEVPVNGSMERTVHLMGYPRIAAGTYTCSFTFANPIAVKRGERRVQGGRIWIGSVESKTISVVVP